MVYLGYFPLIGTVVLVYNFLAFGGQIFGAGGADSMDATLAGQVFQIHMVSGEHWKVTVGDLLVLFGLVTLFQEVLRATSVTKIAIVNHGLSLMLFVVALIEFLIIKGFATSTFFLVLCMTLIDVVAGFSISIISSRRDVSFDSDKISLS